MTMSTTTGPLYKQGKRMTSREKDDVDDGNAGRYMPEGVDGKRWKDATNEQR